jgi:sirohydrochlorin cobalto/nickelchelatase
MEKDKQSNEDIGILLIGHGSSLPEGNSTIYELYEKYKKTSKNPVEVGFMNIEKPTIPSALNILAKKGVKRIIAVPLFLAHGLHTKQDIPFMLGLCEPRKDAGYYSDEREKILFKGQINYIEPFGADPRIAQIIEKKVEDSLKNSKLP